MDTPLTKRKTKKRTPVAILADAQKKLEYILEEEKSILEEESLTIKDESVSESISDSDNVLLISLKNAYMSNIIARQIGEKVCNKRIKVLYNKLLKGNNYYGDFSIVITHLYSAKFVGNYSYTFKREIIIKNEYDLRRLDNKKYVWPEVFNNIEILKEKTFVVNILKLLDAEYRSIEEILRSGKIIHPYTGEERVCYKPVDNCTLETCKLVKEKVIYMPELNKDKQVVAYCFEETQLFDIILANIIPINPFTKKPFPKHLVDGMRQKYKNELLMRAYYLLELSEEQKLKVKREIP